MQPWEKRTVAIVGLILGVVGIVAAFMLTSRFDTSIIIAKRVEKKVDDAMKIVERGEQKFDRAIAIAEETKLQVDATKANSDTLVRQSEEALTHVGVLVQRMQEWQLDERLRRWDNEFARLGTVAEEAHGVLTSSVFRLVFRKEER